MDYCLYGCRGDVEIDNDDEMNEVSGDEEYWQHNFLTNWGEFFDLEPKHFIIGKNDNIIVLWLDCDKNGAGEVHSSTMQRHVFKDVLDAFVDWFYKLDGNDVLFVKKKMRKTAIKWTLMITIATLSLVSSVLVSGIMSMIAPCR